MRLTFDDLNVPFARTTEEAEVELAQKLDWLISESPIEEVIRRIDNTEINNLIKQALRRAVDDVTGIVGPWRTAKLLKIAIGTPEPPGIINSPAVAESEEVL